MVHKLDQIGVLDLLVVDLEDQAVLGQGCRQLGHITVLFYGGEICLVLVCEDLCLLIIEATELVCCHRDGNRFVHLSFIQLVLDQFVITGLQVPLIILHIVQCFLRCVGQIVEGDDVIRFGRCGISVVGQHLLNVELFRHKAIKVLILDGNNGLVALLVLDFAQNLSGCFVYIANGVVNLVVCHILECKLIFRRVCIHQNGVGVGHGEQQSILKPFFQL